ncbi:MAG: hydroxymethylbilane synthase [Bacteroidota bacterium]
MPEVLRIGTRRSALALWQAEHVAQRLREAWPDLVVELIPFVTQGDRILDRPLPEIGGKGVFTVELEAALRAGELDLAVHSLKDLPTDDPEGITVGAIPGRADPGDAWVCPAGIAPTELPDGAVVGTSSTRRAAQLLRLHPGLDIRSIRGNVGTRIEKVHAGPYVATVLACAGLDRLGRRDAATSVFEPEAMLPAPGQGALGIQRRSDDPETTRLLDALDDAETRACVEAERHFLAALGGGCSAPVGALAVVEESQLFLRGRVLALDGSEAVDVQATEDVGPEAARRVGEVAARAALTQGAAALLSP